MESLGTKLQNITTGCKLEIRSFSANRKLTASQREQVAKLFNAETKSVNGSRGVFNRRMDKVREVVSLLSQARSFWRSYTVKYEDGVRLIRTDKIDWLRGHIDVIVESLKVAAQELYDCWDEVKLDAQKRLQDLYVESDYAFDPRAVVDVVLTFPAIEPDKRLEGIAPELFKQERERIAAKFAEAALEAEAALKSEMVKLVDGLVDKLEEKASEDGKKKVVQQRAVDALVEFHERFKMLSVSSDTELDDLLSKVKAAAQGVDVASWKKNPTAKLNFAAALKDAKGSLEKLIGDAGVRSFELE